MERRDFSKTFGTAAIAPLAIEDIVDDLFEYKTGKEELADFIHDQLEDAIEEAELAKDYHVKDDWQPLPHQIRPEGDWDIWGLLGGRGAGKTELGSREVLSHLRQYKSKARVGIGAPTLSDVRKTLIEGTSGILAHAAPNEIIDYNRTLLTLGHRSGGVVIGMGSEQPDRWRGPNWTMLWADELSSWNPESWHQARFGLRIGPAYGLFTTTPKNRPLLRELMEEEGTVLTHATTYDNPYLAARAVRALTARYGGTALGRQELEALLLDSADSALWTREMIDRSRVPFINIDRLYRIVVAVDPAVTSNPNSAETGIEVVGKDLHGQGYLLADLSLRGSPDVWAQQIVTAYKGWNADLVIGEVNNGGDLIESVLRAKDPHINYKSVHASRGKHIRAEPVSSLYERDMIHHVGADFGPLEDQLCLWEPHEPDATPNDRLDALVWGFTELFVDEIASPLIVPSIVGRKKSKWIGK